MGQVLKVKRDVLLQLPHPHVITIFSLIPTSASFSFSHTSFFTVLHRTKFCNRTSTPTTLVTRIVGPPNSRPKIRPINMVAQAPSTRCRDLICNQIVRWVPPRLMPKLIFSLKTRPLLIRLQDDGPNGVRCLRVQPL